METAGSAESWQLAESEDWAASVWRSLNVMLIRSSSRTFENRKCEQLECQSAEARARRLLLEGHTVQKPSSTKYYDKHFLPF